MTAPRVVLVTGVARYLGGRVAKVLMAQPGIERVIGLDVAPPRTDTGGAEFVRADIRNPLLGKVLADAQVDTVVHLNILSAPAGAGGRSTMKDVNVIGTMQLLAACQQAPSVERLVVRSSAAVYGNSSKDPALFVEDSEPAEPPRSGFAKDAVEVEGYVRGLCRRRPDMAVTLLRFANVIGPGIDSPLTSYLSLPVWPTPLGFDARLQLLHEHDAVEVLRRAAVDGLRTGPAALDAPGGGTFNVAGSGTLLLSQAARRAGRPTVPTFGPLTAWLGETFRRAGVADFSPEQMRYLSFGRGLDCSRLARTGWLPAYSTEQAFDDFLAGRGLRRIVPDAPLDVLESLEDRLRQRVAARPEGVAGA